MSACSGDDGGDESGLSAEPFRLEREVGDCFDRPASPDVTAVPAVPCRQPHDLEAYAAFELPDGPYPGQAPVANQAGTGCEERFEAFVGAAPDATGNLLIVPFVPDRAGWAAGDRRVLCAVSQADEQLTESVAGRGTGA